MEQYLGKTISTFKFEKEKLTFGFSDGDGVVLYAQGDCCSNSWFEVMSGEEALSIGAILRDISFISMSEVELGDWDVLKVYGMKFTTNKGYADVEMRNTSNGFYGGYITINDDDQYASGCLYPKGL